MNIQPLRNLILVRPAEAASQTKHGIIIPDTVKTPPNRGTVIAVGEEVNTIAEGDVVLYHQGVGTEVNIDDDGFLLVPYNQVIGKINP